MSKKDNNTKFDELIQLCSEGTEGISAMAFSPQKSISYGLKKAKFNLPTGFYYSNFNGNIKITGNINSKNISNHTRVETDNEDCVIVIADSRNEDKPTLLIKNTEISKFNKKTNIDGQVTVVIYWEIGDYSYLAYVLNNPINAEIIVDANFVVSNYQRDINRVNCLRLLDKSTSNKLTPLFNEVEDQNNDF